MSRPAARSNPKVIIKESTGRRIIEQSRMRMLCVGFFFVLCFMSISARMIEVAVIRNPQALKVTVFDADNEEKSEEVEIKASDPVLQRGDIVDRNGVLVATSLMTESVFANPKEIRDLPDAAARIGKALGIDDAILLNRLKNNKSFVWIKRNLTPKEQQQVNSLGIPGLYFLPEERRVYPYGNLLVHALGYVGQDNKGLAGIERQFDSRLRDTALNHDPVQLSIDTRLQSLMHEEMKHAMDEFNAIGATGVVLDMSSGEILSMVSLPDFDPHKPAKATDAQKFNRATLGAYEMGSTFKSFTMAMGLDSGIATMKSGYDVSHPLKISTFTISDEHSKGGWLSVPEIYAYSSNIGAAKMALDVGTKHQKAFLEKLGMMQQVDVEIPERATPLYPADWKEINTVTIAYGHGISVSPLHLVRGIASIANGGTLERLTLLKDGNKGRAEGERIVSDQTSQNIRRLMRLVVDHGTGSKADIAGYRVGGKTGTAEKINAGGVYNPNANLASFISVFPVDSPKYLVLVMIDEPKGDKSTYGLSTGGMIAAPVVGRVITRMGPMLGLKPQFDVPQDDAEKYWVNNDKAEKPKAQATLTQVVERRYERAPTY